MRRMRPNFWGVTATQRCATPGQPQQYKRAQYRQPVRNLHPNDIGHADAWP